VLPWSWFLLEGQYRTTLDHPGFVRVQTKHLPLHDGHAVDAFGLTQAEKNRARCGELPIKVERLEFLRRLLSKNFVNYERRASRYSTRVHMTVPK
jgi:hypothetical protein